MDGLPLTDGMQPSNLELLVRYSESENIAAELTEDQLTKIGMLAVSQFDTDCSSREEWLKTAEDGIKLAKQLREDKSFPWDKAANVKYPLLSQAAIEFAARAYPELIKGNVVKGAKIGADPKGEKAARAGRVSTFMGEYQLKMGMKYWEEEMDALLLQLPIVGMVFKKSFFDPLNGIQSRAVWAENFVVNHNTKDLETCRRITEILPAYDSNDVIERQRSGLWLENQDFSADSLDDQAEGENFYQFLEQHCWIDLDDDGYAEPYVVTVQKSTRKVARIVARYEEKDIKVNSRGEVSKIDAWQCYTSYQFLPNFDGGFYALGLSALLGHLNEAINTVINQLLDAGTLANLQSGFIAKGIRIKGGSVKLKPGEWQTVDSTGGNLSQNIVPLPVKEPSLVLFQLLGLLIESGKDLANIKEVLSGTAPSANVPATTVLALIEQGMKVFSAIYKRIYRSMAQEFQKLFVINKRWLDKELYLKVLDDPLAQAADWNSDDYDIRPEADPTMSSDIQAMAQAQALMELLAIPGAKKGPIVENYLKAIKVDDPKRFFDEATGQKEIQQQQNLAIEAAVADNERKNAETMSKVRQANATAIKSLSEAVLNVPLPGVVSALEAIDQLLGVTDGNAEQGGMAGMEQSASDQMVPQQIEGGSPVGAVPPSGRVDPQAVV